MTYRILSFCGGGIRGLLSAGLLTRLAESHPELLGRTDLLAGTSAGSIIISAILAGWPPAKIYEGYQKTRAFHDPGTDNDRPAYQIDHVAAEQRLLHLLDPRLKDVDRSVLFTAFNVGSKDVPWQPLLLHNLPNSETAEYRLVDSVVSSGAMPAMFGSYRGNVDGAFVSHDPTLAAIAVAVSNGHRLEDITAICIGTGFMANWIGSDTSNWGSLQWQGQSDPATSRTPSLLVNASVSPILNLCLNGTSTNLVPQLSAMLLGDRYVNVNPVLDRFVSETDQAPADLQYMETVAASYDLDPAKRLLDRYWS